MRRALVVIALAGCGGAAAAPPATPRAPADREPPAPAPGPRTHVVTLEAAVPTAVLRGPFLVTTINPGAALRLGVSASGRCDDVTWFAYSGGGVAAGAGETLCAWSTADAALTHGFSGDGGR